MKPLRFASFSMLMLLSLLFTLPACTANNHYTIILNDTYGLKKGDQVSIKGKSIGQVESIDLNNNKIVVTIGVDKKYVIYSGASAAIVDVDVLGNKRIEIANSGNKSTRADTLYGKYVEERSLNNIIQKVDSSLRSVADTLLKQTK